MGARCGVQPDDPDEGFPIRDDSFPGHMDVLSAVVAAAIAAATVAFTPAPSRWIVAALMLAGAAPWLLRLWFAPWSLAWPLVTLLALAVLNVAGGPEGWLADVAVGELSLLLLVWLVVDDAVARRRSAARLTFVLALAVVLARGLNLERGDGDAYLGSTWIWMAGLLLSHLGGRLLHHLAVTVVRLRAAEGLVAEHAVAAEQRRIAREVHDVVAHSLSVTALHLSAARMAADRDDGDAARLSILDAERLTRSSLADLRRTVRMLRGDSVVEPEGASGGPSREADGLEPALPGISDIVDLVGSIQAAGTVVELELPDAALIAQVDDLTALTAYRIVQESLTNALRHQGRPTATVRVSVDLESVDVVVRSTGPCTSGTVAHAGHGLIGMRERVDGLHGRLDVGPTPDGWAVRATLGLHAPPAPGDDVGARPLAVASTSGVR